MSTRVSRRFTLLSWEYNDDDDDDDNDNDYDNDNDNDHDSDNDNDNDNEMTMTMTMTKYCRRLKHRDLTRVVTLNDMTRSMTAPLVHIKVLKKK